MAGPRRRKRIKRFLRFAAMWPFLTVLEALPRPLARSLGSAYGRLAWMILPRLRAKSRAQRAVLETGADGVVMEPHFDRAVFEWIGRTAVDFLRLGKDDQALAEVQIEGLEHLESTEASGRATLLATAHFGSWELLGSWLARRTRPISVLYHPFSEARLDERVCRIRRRAGIGLLPVRGSALPIRRALADGTLVGVLLDRVPRGVGVDSLFFGKPCRTDPGTARLALLTRALVLVAAMWEDRPGHYRIRFWPPIDADEVRGDPQPVPKLVQKLDAHVEEMIVQAPSQWPWFYPRWKIRGRSYEAKK